MWYVWLGLFLLYLVATWRQLQREASPMLPCHPGSNCFHPLLSAGDPSVMQLWLYQPFNDTKTYIWTPVETCRLNISIPDSGVLPVDVTGNVTTCSVPLPDFARMRSTDREPKPLQALFRFSHPDRVGSAIVDVPFELTRIIQRKGGIGLFSTSSSSQARNLLEEPVQTASRNKEPDGPEWVPYLKYGRSPIRLRFIAEYREYGTLQRRDGVRLQPWNKTTYRPIIYIDDNSLQHSSKIELAPPENNKPPVKLSIKISALSPVVDSLNHQVTMMLSMAEDMLPGPELDEIRYFMQDERLYRFLITQIISYLHMWFDYMAFRDEIRFYRGRKNLSGVSASSVISRFLCSFIILLYLMDGGGTSWVIILSLFSSCVVEGWKVWRLLRPTFKRSFPFVSIRELATAGEQETASYDRIASTNLALVLYPLVVGWSLYALQHYVYTSWYSWLISNLANAVYTFGFIALCPQLYVNYRLKSVAHLPWKVFMYKIFNTFVDDAFAWLIEMPWKHRIMTLRDDVVFLLLLVQVYQYRVDKTRTNEFGYSYEEGEKSEELTEANQIEHEKARSEINPMEHEKAD
jgi:hypothetical protein